MCAKVVLAFCTQALFLQTAFSQCLGTSLGWAGPGLATGFSYDRFPRTFGYDRFIGPLAYDNLAPWAGRGIGGGSAYSSAIDITPTSSGRLIVTSASPVAPTGISVISETAYEGVLAVAGETPFVGTTGMEGVVPTVGAAAVSHACGNGNNFMISDVTGCGAYGSADVAPGIAPVFGSAIIPEIVPAYSSCGCGYLQ